MNKSIKRGHKTNNLYPTKPLLVSRHGFKIINGNLQISTVKKKFESNPLNKHILKILDDKSLIVKSFALTENMMEVSFSIFTRRRLDRACSFNYAMKEFKVVFEI